MNIPVFLYKILASLIAPTVSMLFNNSLSEGIFPECFKTVKLFLFSNLVTQIRLRIIYRPISMLPFLSKMFEKLMCDRLDLYLESNNILCIQISLAPAKIPIHRMQLLNFLIMFIHH